MIYIKKFNNYDEYLEHKNKGYLTPNICAIVGLKRTFFLSNTNKSRARNNVNLSNFLDKNE